MKRSIRLELFSVFFVINVVFALVFLGVNTFFLDGMYIADYKRKLLKTYNHTQTLFTDNSNLQNLVATVNKIPGAYITIIDSQLQVLSSTAPEILLNNSLNEELKQKILKLQNLNDNEPTLEIIDYGESSNTSKKLLTLIGTLSNERIIIMERLMFDIKNTVDVAVRLTAISALIALGIGFVLLFYLSDNLTKPILKIIRKTKEIAELNFNGKIEIKNKDEIGQLGKSINKISEKLNQALEDLKRSNSEYKKASQAKSLFLANMSHELRTPLNGIIGYSDILRTTPLEDEQKKFADIVFSSAKHLSEVISDILDFSRIEAGKLELSPEKTDLRKLIDDTCSIVRFRAQSKGIDLDYAIENTVPQMVTVDGPRLRQILVNLLTNAVKFTDEGSVQLSVNIQERQADKVHLLFKVTDTGMGIREKEQKKIFDPFHQADMSTSKKAEGTGLGLAIVQNLLERMSSALRLRSVFGEGSTFYFELLLPYEKKEPTELYQTKAEKKVEVKSFKDKKVLIAEDNPVNLNYVQTALSMFSKDIQVITAENGNDVYKQYLEHKPDLILMDIVMPEIDGYQATAMIRNRDSKIPIIAMTARVLKEDRDDCFRAGMNDYIAKPVSLDQLKEILKKYL